MHPNELDEELKSVVPRNWVDMNHDIDKNVEAKGRRRRSHGQKNWAQMQFNSGKPSTDSSIKDLSESNLILVVDTLCRFILQVANMDGKFVTPRRVCRAFATRRISVLVLIEQLQGKI